MMSLSARELRQFRSYSQGLATNFPNPEKTIRNLVGIQSQELDSASIALHARGKNLNIQDVQLAREHSHSIVLTWAMRGTMHLVHAEDLGWLTDLLGEKFIRASQSRYQELGLTPSFLQKSLSLIQEFLDKNTAMSRAELAKALEPHQIPVAGQAMPHLLRYAALKGLICFGAEHEGEFTYVLVKDWLKEFKPYKPKHPEAELAQRYFEAYAPAKLEDFIAWSGLSSKQAKAGFEAIVSELIELESQSEKFWIFQKKEPVFPDFLCLLPRYDNYLLAYQNRNFMVDKAYAKKIHPGGGLIQSPVIIDGEAKGVWRIEKKRSQSKVVLECFETIPSKYHTALEKEVAEMGKFLNKTLALELLKP